jgi:hypothetical protein
MGAGLISSKTTPFIEAVLNGEASLAEIDDFVEAWHSGTGEGVTLREYLGMSEPEYSRFARSESALVQIIAERRAATAKPHAPAHRGRPAAKKRPVRAPAARRAV